MDSWRLAGATGAGGNPGFGGAIVETGREPLDSAGLLVNSAGIVSAAPFDVTPTRDSRR